MLLQEIPLTDIKYRYKYRKCSTSDPRPIWSLVYSIVDGNKVKNGRLLLKADDRFFEILEEHVPGRIRVPQADIVFYAAVRADAVKHGEGQESPEAQRKYQSAADLDCKYLPACWWYRCYEYHACICHRTYQ